MAPIIAHNRLTGEKSRAPLRRESDNPLFSKASGVKLIHGLLGAIKPDDHIRPRLRQPTPVFMVRWAEKACRTHLICFRQPSAPYRKRLFIETGCFFGEGVRPCAVHYHDVTPVKWAYNQAHDVGVVPCRQTVPPRQKFIVSAASLHQAAPVFCAVRTAHYQLRSLKAPKPRCKPPEIKRRQLLAPKLPMRSLATGEADVVWAAESGAFVPATPSGIYAILAGTGNHWCSLQRARARRDKTWFALVMKIMHTMGATETSRGRIYRCSKSRSADRP
jgi:hypothetical protein